MMTIVTGILTMVAQIVPGLSTAAALQSVIGNLVALVPALVQEYKDLVPVVKNIIAALRTNEAVTKEQLDQLDALDAQCDAAFEAAATAAEAEDAAAKAQG